MREIENTNGSLKHGLKVRCKLNWERRYKLMRMHTATHILSALLNKQSGALITGNQLDMEQTRIDFNLENFDRDLIQQYVYEANALIKKGAEVKVSFISREEAMKDESLFRLAAGFKHDFQEIRIVEIKDIDKQADGGTHVKNIKECGNIELIKLENKGKSNRRLYFKLNPV